MSTATSATFRRTLGTFATGVTVVTTKTENGPAGCTVNSFSSVSLHPMLVQICLAKNTAASAAVREAGFFVVNILAQDQQDVSDIFATLPPDERFDRVRTRPGVSGAPLLEGTLAAVEARVTQVVDAGDHDLILGEVLSMDVRRPDAAPLLYFRGKYGVPAASLARTPVLS